MAIIKQRNKEDDKGDTTAKGSYVLNDDGTLLTSFSVTKDGRSGTGKGRYACILFGDEGKKIFEYHKGFSVGAVPTQPDTTKHDDQTFDILQLDKVVTVGMFVDAVSDSIGIPTDIDGWVDLLGEGLIPIIGGLGIGDFTEVKGWIFDRVK